MERICTMHGLTKHSPRKEGGFRCSKCASDAVQKRRRKIRDILIEEAGGCCKICGYDIYHGALDFHHLDPLTKSFGISSGHTRSLDSMREEAAKCVLLCSNCHAEVEAGITILSSRPGDGA